jgi:predicted DNA-binding protein with PD1-like motif
MKLNAILWSTTLILAVCATPAIASVRGSFQRTLQVTGPVDLEVLSHSGDISVHSGPAGTVSISGKIQVDNSWLTGDRQAEVSEVEKNPPIRQAGNSIHIDYPAMRHISIDYDITVPADTALRTRSGSGDQTVEGLRTNIELESGSGDMRLRDIQGEVHVHTGSGNVDAMDIAGPITAEAGSGDIRLEEKSLGDVRVHTGSGNVDINGINGALRAEAGSGDITVGGTLTAASEIRTGSGDVRLRLPDQAAFDLEASTSSGEVVVDRPVAMIVQGNLQKAHRAINGKVNGGGPPLTIHTGSGDVEIH